MDLTAGLRGIDPSMKRLLDFPLCLVAKAESFPVFLTIATALA